MSEPEFVVFGGPDGRGARMAVDVATLRDAARVVDEHARLAEDVAARLARQMADPSLLRTAALDARGAADAQQAAAAVLLRGSGSVAGRAALTAARLRAAAAIAEHGEDVARLLATRARNHAMATAGGALFRATIATSGGLAVGALAATAVYYDLLAVGVGVRWLRTGPPPDFEGDLSVADAPRLAVRMAQEAFDDGNDRALGALAQQPELAEQLVGGAPAFLGGLTGLVRLQRAGPFRGLGLDATPDDVPELAARLALLSGLSPALRDRPVAVAPTSSPPPAPRRPPRGPGDVVARLAAVSDGDDRSRVRVEKVTAGDGQAAWVVLVPGMQTMGPEPAGNAFGPAAVLPAAAGATSSATTRAVVDALVTSGARPGQPVMLVGHSYGGMAAAQIAADPAVRRRVTPTAVLTVGAPVGSSDVPDDVAVLSVEHTEDLVVALDGEPNPDEAHRTTARREVLDPENGDASVRARFADDPWAPHDVDAYARTTRLLEDAGKASVDAWTERAAPFWDAPDRSVEASDWTLTRQPAGADGGGAGDRRDPVGPGVPR